MKEITLTDEDFKDIATDVAANLMHEAERHGVEPSLIGLITAMYCARLHTKLFEDDKLEVE